MPGVGAGRIGRLTCGGVRRSVFGDDPRGWLSETDGLARTFSKPLATQDPRPFWPRVFVDELVTQSLAGLPPGADSHREGREAGEREQDLSHPWSPFVRPRWTQLFGFQRAPAASSKVASVAPE